MHKPIMLIFTLSLLGSLCVGLVGPIYPIYVLKRFSATIVDTGILYATFCIVAAVFKAPAGKLVDKHGIFYTCSCCQALSGILAVKSGKSFRRQ